MMKVSITLFVVFFGVLTIESINAQGRLEFSNAIFLADSSKKEFIERKKEMMVKEYDSLFQIYDRETTLVTNYRSWCLLLLGIFFTFVYTIKPSRFRYVVSPVVIIIVTTILMEISERSVMLYLLKELRNLERVFMLEDKNKFNYAVTHYTFRDLKDENRSFFEQLKFYGSCFSNGQVLMQMGFWLLFLIAINWALLRYYNKNLRPIKKNRDKND